MLLIVLVQNALQSRSKGHGAGVGSKAETNPNAKLAKSCVDDVHARLRVMARPISLITEKILHAEQNPTARWPRVTRQEKVEVTLR
jgi:hypothetical protein